jgi:DNA polymerase-4
MKKEYIFPRFVGAGSNYKLCPHAIFLPVDYGAYVAASQQFKSVMKTLCPIMEDMGIDVAFLNISELPEENDIMWKIGTSVKK